MGRKRLISQSVGEKAVDQVMMMAMQLVEEFSGRLASGQTLMEDEAMAYHQTLSTVKTYMQYTKLNYMKGIKEMQTPSEEEDT